MIELTAYFTAQTEGSPLDVRLFRPDTGTWTTPVPFELPLDDPELAELHWYLELFSEWPTGPDYQRAERIEAQMEDWGRALRDSIITDPEAARGCGNSSWRPRRRRAANC
jgi:hypothetical protein